VLKRIVDFEVAPPPPRDSRGLIALGISALVHAFLVLLFIFGIPTSAPREAQNAAETAAQPLAMQPPSAKPLPALKKNQPQPPESPQPPPPPPPPLKEVELGPDSKKPDAPAKEAAAKQTVPDQADPTAAKQPTPVPKPPAADQPKPLDAQPPAPQRIQVPRPGDYTALGAVPLPTTSPWGPPKLDSASGALPTDATAAPAATSMGRVGLTNHDPKKWEKSFDDETSGQCVAIPDLGRNPDGSPVLAAVNGRILDSDGRTALGGAHLQIVGTQFGTFTQGNGQYRLEFDPKLLQKCRVQYVHVEAAGHASQDLKLAIGPKVISDDVILHRH
jgi:hypothetical protein